MPIRSFAIFLTVVLILWNGCSSAPKQEDAPPHPAPPIAPPYVQVPHPFKHDMADVQAIFHSKQAPAMDSLKTCDASVEKLREKTVSVEEFKLGVQELVRTDPVGYHWCFYGKILELEKILKEDTFVDEKQKHVLGTYSFLVPVAKGYMAEFQDSRYLRWAISYYTKLSEWVFYRRVETGPAMTQELVEAADAYHAWRGHTPEGQSVLEKYNLVPPGKYEGEVKLDTKAAKVETLTPPTDGAPAKTPEEVPLTWVSDSALSGKTPVTLPTPTPTPTPSASPVAVTAPVVPERAPATVTAAPPPVAPATPPAQAPVTVPATPAVAPEVAPSMPTAPLQQGP